MVGVIGHDRQAVAGGDEEVPSQDHIAVPVPVRCRPQVGGVVAAVHQLDQLAGMDQIRIRMGAAEILQGPGVDDGPLGGAEPVFQNLHRIGAGDRVHGVKAKGKQAGIEQCMDAVKIKQVTHQFGVIGHRIDDVDLHGTELPAAGTGKVYIRGIQNMKCVDGA